MDSELVFCYFCFTGKNLLQNTIPILVDFHKKYVKTELLTRELENKAVFKTIAGKSKRKLLCVCQNPYYDQENWIGCDVKNCKYK